MQVQSENDTKTDNEVDLQITVRGKKYDCDMTLHDRVTVIIGESGRGKTVFADAAEDVSGAYKVSLSKPEYTITVLRKRWQAVLKEDISEQNKCVYIIDDDDGFIYSEEFSTLYKDIVDCYFIFILRFTESRRASQWNRIAYAADAVYEFVAEGRKHYLQRAFKYSNAENIGSIDLCLVEDEGSGCEFMRKLFVNVQTVSGRDNLIPWAKEHAESMRGKTVYLVVDFAAAGLKLKDSIDYFKRNGVKPVFSAKYKSFEYMLLKSNFFKMRDNEIYTMQLLREISLERHCTRILQGLTQGKLYRYSKSKDSIRCYIEDCCYRSQRDGGCDRGIAGDKLQGLLVGTEFDFLLKYRQTGGVKEDA